MSKKMTEEQVLKILKIKNFRHITKEQILAFANNLKNLDPEVAKKIIEQFPNFSRTMISVFDDFKAIINKGIDCNQQSMKAFYDSCNASIVYCQTLLASEELSFEQKKEILEYIARIQDKLFMISSENKKFIKDMTDKGLKALVFLSIMCVIVLGGSWCINSNDKQIGNN